MRIIAGESGGRKLVAPAGLDTRPSSDRLRESLFSILAPRLPGARVLDLFCGSGALAMESLSRGADGAVLSDASPAAVRAARANIDALCYGARAELLHCDFRRALAALAARRARAFDLVFLDPPYAHTDWYALCARTMAEGGLLAPGARIVCECSRRLVPTLPPPFAVCDRRQYGDSVLLFVRNDEQGGEYT